MYSFKKFVGLLKHFALVACFLGSMGFSIFAPFQLHGVKFYYWLLISPMLFISASYGWNRYTNTLRKHRDNKY